MTQRVVLLDRPLSLGIAAAMQHFWGLLTKRVADHRSENHAPSLVEREIQAVLLGLSVPKRILDAKTPKSTKFRLVPNYQFSDYCRNALLEMSI